ncbi:choice-of-anchor D domain-containing protein [Kribbella sp. NPDC026611]|uniref:choice-of-anchor D domain-containing protein n=1 Tax=Kribbella sp. NPDC026611 TaxID=3154911 RepID=UPI003407F1F6
MSRRPTTLLLLIGLLTIASTLATRPAGAVPPGATEVVSVGAAGNQSAGVASSPVVSADGSQVAFESQTALDPVVQAGTAYNVYVRDRRAPGRTVLISRALAMTYLGARGYAVPLRTTAALEQGGNGDSLHPSISATGRYVAFDSVATDLRDGNAEPVRRIVLCDRDPDNDGVFDELRPDGLMDFTYLDLSSTPGATGSDPSLSAAGTVVAWREQLPGTTNAITGARLTLDPQGRPLPPDLTSYFRPETDADAGAPELSADGHEVVFSTGSCPAFASCSDPIGSLQLYDIPSDRLTRVDHLPDGTLSGAAAHPTISANGRTIAYEHLVPNGPRVVVVTDSNTAGASFASRDSSGRAADGAAPAISADARYLAFVSTADGMHDDAQGTDRPAIVLRDLTLDAARERSGLPRLPGDLGNPAAEPCSDRTCPATGPSGSPRLSATGSVLVFTSASNDLTTPPCCAGAVFARVFQPRVTAQPVVFGSVETGSTTARTVTLQHTGFGPLTIDSMHIEGDIAFALNTTGNCTGATLHTEASCALSVEVHPSSTGQKQAVLRITQSDGTTVDIDLRADAIPVPPGASPTPSGGLIITPDPIEFGGTQPALVALSNRTAEVHNSATTPITISAVGILSGPHFAAGDFTVRTTTCAARRLGPGEGCTVQLGATPQLPGPRSGVLAITTTDPTYSALIPLVSQATYPTLIVNPAVVRANRVTTVTAQNFPPDRAVTITVPGTALRAAATTDHTGRLSAPLLVFPQTSAGSWYVVASVTGTRIQAQSTILVVPGSYQPPDFTSRR